MICHDLCFEVMAYGHSLSCTFYVNEQLQIDINYLCYIVNLKVPVFGFKHASMFMMVSISCGTCMFLQHEFNSITPTRNLQETNWILPIHVLRTESLEIRKYYEKIFHISA